jgi:putative ABC transport system permease protein
MIRNILLSAFASLKRKKMASLFTILTISLGMTMVVLLASFYHSYTGNVGPYVNRDRCLYLSDLTFEKDGRTVKRIMSQNATASFINETLHDFGPEAIVGLYGRIHEENFGPRYNSFRIKYLETDANFWKIHQFKFLDGKPFSEKEVNDKEQVTVISRKMALHFLGNTTVAGQYIVDEGQRKVRIVGVIEDVNPHFEVGADYYLPYTISVWDEEKSYEGEGGNQEYYNRGDYKGVILAQKRADFNSFRKEFDKTIDRMNKTGQVEEYEKVNVSLRTPAQQIPSLIGLAEDETGAMIFISMGFIFLLLPIIILSNINLYVLRNRLEEIGIRKSFGAKRRDIISQFFAENILVTAMGCLIALFFGYFVNRILAYILYRTTEIPGFEFNIHLFFYLIVGTVLFGIITIVLPVIRISGVQPVTAINQDTTSGQMQVRFKTRKKWLQATTHLLLSMVLILCCLMLVLFYDYISGLGYETKNVIKIIVDEKDQKIHDDNYNSTRFEGYRERLLRIDGVEKVSYVLENPPFWIVPQYQEYVVNGETKKIRTLETDSCFFDLLEIKPLKGELYPAQTIEGNYLAAIATLEGEQRFFGGEAIGKIIKRTSDGQNIKIIGVIEKYKHHPQASYLPGIMVCRNRPSRSVLLKFNPNADLIAMQNEISNLTTNWKGAEMFFSENDIIDIEKRRAMKLAYTSFYAASLAISFLFLNAFMGYFTLIYYNVQTRRREMGIRRATGANKGRIIRKILGENLSIMLIGSFIALALLWQLFHLVKFDKWEFFWTGYWLSLAIGLTITLGSALIPAIKASKVQPIEALAEE